MRLIEINNLYSLCNSLVISNEYDSLYKSYYKVLIKKLKNEDISNEDHDFLVYLSRLCPKIYGSLAYKGNALLEGIFHLESLSDNCAPQQLALQNSNTDNTNNNCEIKLYPNPIDGSQELFVRSTCQFENGYLIDVYGNHITLYPGLQSTDETNLLISKANIISGIYFLQINFKNGNVFMKKIIFN
ncbi:MAG: T9SS type A sorting domain-containing protein [Saprospiraceae bacterium]|nr:T9SS type A sorting domain-containing protein [Saprospiraceae bacterium]HMW37928.1 T9SS type A sorting domain-containing protein [Saprospiraceae bacterium]HMX87328.1 T9SS type A sorting domain-containing protein [Saprospiraceae bacterium]HMZ39155.1 T9SS type A sorting domain-containing protein [Saprospiraceae bacterium]HNA63816.1 T9SS type A sorting domain-containing protein [Saprospiraceae bacterium]